ncbi:hypothetical protein LSH36_7g09005 [Paralvinella palmiformis]|uniref:SOCS box domain-containing protein n=1 Tax=Paralvinella palmiformis TaxID=53620 RepID=A0AAD9KFD1_9ANNE|nr:hypothetical protein LSH36_7g09005 [Paralvinella palmiformis]
MERDARTTSEEDDAYTMEYSRRDDSNLSNDFRQIWETLKDKMATDDIRQIVRSTACDIRRHLDNGELEATDAVNEILSFASLDQCLCLDDRSTKCTRLLLLEALDICASYNVPDRVLTRTILARLYSYHNKIDREVVFCDFNRSKLTDADIPVVAKRKRRYILENVAGWRINCIDDDFYLSSRTEYYLELPLTSSAGSEDESYILTDALYRQADPGYVLLLLRHGMPASCVHLWPIIMSFDLRLTLRGDFNDPDEEEEAVNSWREMRILRYFCRSRANFVVHVVLGEGEDKATSFTAKYEDTLIVSPSVKPYIPTDRYRHTASLQHLCRLSIRSALIQSDNLPRGIQTLVLPNTLQDYIDLLTD